MSALLLVLLVPAGLERAPNRLQGIQQRHSRIKRIVHLNGQQRHWPAACVTWDRFPTD
jgi:hypothetical protein